MKKPYEIDENLTPEQAELILNGLTDALRRLRMLDKSPRRDRLEKQALRIADGVMRYAMRRMSEGSQTLH